MPLVPPPLSMPGVYIQEVPTGLRTIVAATTSVTAFVGRTLMGPEATPTAVTSLSDFEGAFGLLPSSAMTRALQDFFNNGGGTAVIVRLYQPPSPTAGAARIAFAGDEDDEPAFTLQASSRGAWGRSLSYSTDTDALPPGLRERYATDAWDASDLMNLTVQYSPGEGPPRNERFVGVSADPAAGPRFIGRVLKAQSRFARLGEGTPEGPELTSAGLTKDTFIAGLDALERASSSCDFNLLCIPPDTHDGARFGDTPPAVNAAAAELCQQVRALLLVDAPTAWLDDPSSAALHNFQRDTGIQPASTVARFAAVFFPRILQPDLDKAGLPTAFPASGAIAGVYARTDGQRGVWSAAAGFEASLIGVTGASQSLTDPQTGSLNQQGINSLRSFPATGPVIWGARTMRGADALADDYKYIPSRRLASHIERSISRGIRWAVFEANDTALWDALRLQVGAFMSDLFRQGALQGNTATDAFFVQCDASTTTSTDQQNGIVNLVVGFAPVRPAEFVVLYFQQLANQKEST
jgi:uncharacterized protein